MTIREKILELLNEKNYKPLLMDELLIEFQIEKAYRKDFKKVVDGLEKEGLILKLENDRYVAANPDYIVPGILQGHERGFGFVIKDSKEKDDIFIAAENMNGAMDGDRVLVNIVSRKGPGKREEGEIIRILERNNKFIVGTLEESRNFSFLIPDNPKISYDVFIPKSQVNKAKDRQKVVIEIEKWPDKRRNPEGKVVEILGYPEDKGTDILSVIRQFQLPEKFPDEVKKEAKSISKTIAEEEIRRRRDLRSLKTFTIDGADAKDLDDAISIERLENGNYKLGVHIADVAHYVKENSNLDREALKRGNSVYLIDRVVPMLPEELSNGICSLNPYEDRLTLSVTMEINHMGKVVKHEIQESVINSKARLVYDDVSDYIEDKTEESREKLKDLLDELDAMEELMKILRKKREKRGSIDFDFPETKIVLDDKGIPIHIGKDERRIANKLIEEFMLVTNETVGEEYFWAELPFLYRVHEEPSQEKIQDFAKFIYNFGYSLKGKELHPKDFQILTEEIRGKKEETVISTLLLRSMRKARYSEENDIHFGLASNHYSHFTSPIRRYPDLMIHRIIKENLNGQLNEKRIKKLEKILPRIAEQTSNTEKRAEEAEREVEDLKKAQFMVDKIGEEYEGIISSLTNFGIFVQLDNTIEGLIHFNDMLDDYYHFDEEKYYIIGERTNRIFKLGERVNIVVNNVNLNKKNIDFQLLV